MLLPMLRRPAALAALLLALAPGTAAASSPSLTKAKSKSDFLLAMKSATGIPPSVRRARTARARLNLRRKIAAAAKPASSVPSYRRSEANSNSNSPDGGGPTATPRRLEDGGDNGDGDGDEYSAQADYASFGFDIGDFSLKYAGCSAVATYSDDMAENEDAATVVMSKRFVVFRLCPTAYCSDDQTYGCSSDYGEYVVSMDEYLQMIAEYKEEQLERYCEYCEECMEEEEQAEEEEEEEEQEEEEDEEEEDEEEEEEEQDEDEDEDEEEDEDGRRKARRKRRLDDAAGDDAAAQEDEAGDDAAQADDADQEHACADYDACYNYASVCDADDNGDGDDAAEQLDYAEFFECQEFDNDNDNDNGNQYYLGPHCSSDKSTITIGVFSDEECSVYVGDSVTFDTVTGVEYDEDVMADYYTTDCTSCRESENPYENVDEDEEDGDDINELCENLYERSAKCNRALSDAEDESYYSYNQEANEGAVCAFISNIVTGQYDELGYIYLDSDEYAADNKDNRYAQTTGEVSIGQIFGLLFVVLACLVLSIWACFLHRSLTRKSPWRPRKSGGNASAAGAVSRQNSGIVMGRSRSGGSYHGGQMA